MADDVENFQKQKSEAEKMLASFGKYKLSENMTMQFISVLSADAKLLSDKIASNELKPQQMGEKITTLFKEAERELQEIETPKLQLKTRLTPHVRPHKVSGI